MFSDPDDGENAAVINTISDLLKPLVFLFCALFSALLLRNFPFGCSPHFIFWYKPFIHGCDMLLGSKQLHLFHMNAVISG